MEYMMTVANQEQADHWNGGDESGHWLLYQDKYDRQLEPFAALILDAAGLTSGESVLDVGCGCGATTRAAAQLVDPGSVVGIDLSRPMLARAREGADSLGLRNTAFIEGDAQVYPFVGQSFDVIISRFGVMFFDDPVRAFVNIRRSAKGSGRLIFVCWQPMVDNEWLLVPGAAVAALVPLPDLGPPDAPGMFALSKPERIQEVLRSAGWNDVEITAAHPSMLLGGGGSLDDTVEFLRTGSIGRTLLKQADEPTATKAVAAVREALTPHADADGVRMNTAAWIVQAKA
jgi:SAM-dependent methyltransferase